MLYLDLKLIIKLYLFLKSAIFDINLFLGCIFFEGNKGLEFFIRRVFFALYYYFSKCKFGPSIDVVLKETANECSFIDILSYSAYYYISIGYFFQNFKGQYTIFF